MKRLLQSTICFLVLAASSLQAQPGDNASPRPEATPVDQIKVLDGFKVERLYSVPNEQQGSWVAVTMDDQQRFIVSDQYGGLYRFPVPAAGKTIQTKDIEKIDLDIGGAQGLLYAFDSLYCVLNTDQHGGRGLYRLTDTDGDDKFDKKEVLRTFSGRGGEHGPHAVLLSPDKKSLYIVVGNQTPVTDLDSSRVPQIWDEDLVLDRPYGRGFMKGVTAPGGWIAKTDPDGKEWELMATGFRNEYDAAFNQEGELFTFDADMEWDMNTPWYRPTRINHVVSGSEFGWRNGGGKWPADYPDSIGAIVDVGPGSPTGVTFGYGAKFPAKYQDALFVCDWSYGKLYAIHIEPDGASFKATAEPFVSAQPLPLTDIVVNPEDGAMYFAVGGRRVQSGFYRVTYVGKESTEPAPIAKPTRQAKLRKKLETLHHSGADNVDLAWKNLNSDDRSIRFAARVALEHHPLDQWQGKLADETATDRIIQASLALSRTAGDEQASATLAKLQSVDWKKLDSRQQLDLLRAFGVLLARHGKAISATDQSALASQLNQGFPTANTRLDTELLQLLVYLEHPEAASKGIALLAQAPSQEEQMGYAKSLRHLKTGWNSELRTELFNWFAKAGGYRGGASFEKFVGDMKSTAVKNTPKDVRATLKSVIEQAAAKPVIAALESRPFVKDWKLADFDKTLTEDVSQGRNFANGRKMFGQAACYSCHRFNQEGGAIGPDLTSVFGKFNPRDLLEQIVVPSKVISDQYEQMTFLTLEGKVINGRIMNLANDTYRVNTNMMDPNAITTIKVDDIEQMMPSKVSMMPAGLINTLSKDDVLDLLAYMLARGNAEDQRFKK